MFYRVCSNNAAKITYIPISIHHTHWDIMSDSLNSAFTGMTIHGDSGMSTQDADNQFAVTLKVMSKKRLNNLVMADYTTKQRSLIDKERCARKAAKESKAKGNKQVTIVMPYRTYPELHNEVTQGMTNMEFNDEGTNGDVIDTCERHVVGSFTCSNVRCRKSVWHSGKIFTRVLIYRGSYVAHVYNQRCKSCDAMGEMNMDPDIYVERVSRYLKIHLGMPVPNVDWTTFRPTPEHEREYCEGCAAGYCEMGSRMTREY